MLLTCLQNNKEGKHGIKGLIQPRPHAWLPAPRAHPSLLGGGPDEAGEGARVGEATEPARPRNGPAATAVPQAAARPRAVARGVGAHLSHKTSARDRTG